MKTSFILHKDSLKILSKLTDEQAGRLFKAIAQYQNEGFVPELDFALDLVVTQFINQFERDNESYQKVVDRNRKNGENGGRPKKEPKKPSGLSGNPKNPSEPKKPDSDSDNDNESDNENETASFDLFWNLYDKKVGKRDKVKKKWNKLSQQVHEKIIEHVKCYIESQPDKQYRKNPETYLNAEAWNDEIIKPQAPREYVADNGRPLSEWEISKIKEREQKLFEYRQRQNFQA